MKKYLLVSSVLFVCFHGALSQSPGKLLKILPTLKGKAKIDCLIEIRTHYSYMGVTKSDSAYYYSALAYDDAMKLGYKKGIALSLLGLKTESDSLRILNAVKAIKIGEEINDNEVLGWAYYNLPTTKKDSLSNIERMKKSIYHFHKAGNLLREAEVTNWICMEYSGTAKEEGFDYCQRSVELSKKIRSSVKGWESWGQYLYNFSLMSMSALYEQGGDYSAAMDQLRLARQSAIGTGGGWGMEDVMSQLFNKMSQYDSSLYYLQILTKTDKRPFVNVLFGETYLFKKDYQLAQQKFQQAIDSTRNTTKYKTLMKALLGIGKVYEAKNEYQTALKSVNEGLEISKRFNTREFIMDSYEILSRLHHQVGKNDSAYHYLHQYMILKDSANNKQFLWKLNMKLNNYKRSAIDAKKETQLALLGKDNKIKEEQLKQEASFKKFLLIGLLLLFIASVFIVRTLLLKRKNDKLKSLQLENDLRLQQLENEKRQTEFQKKAAELEMQALRAQMNPHFIFNCLNSINRFIFKNETREASDYLTRFSRLIRMVLLHSQKKLVPLEDELEMLKLYLDMERLRFKNAFDYHITTTNAIENSSVFIPPLLLQPFCENAIWHGLMHKDGAGHLNIELNEDNGILNCIITDDGVGREKAEEYKSKSAEKEKSMGLKITKERLSLLNQGTTGGTFYEIEDVVNEQGEIAGTRVQLKIKYKENVEELV